MPTPFGISVIVERQAFHATKGGPEMDTNETNPNSSTQSSSNTNSDAKVKRQADLTWKEKTAASIFLIALPTIGFAVGRWLTPSCHCPMSSQQNDTAEAQMG